MVHFSLPFILVASLWRHLFHHRWRQYHQWRVNVDIILMWFSDFFVPEQKWNQRLLCSLSVLPSFFCVQVQLKEDRIEVEDQRLLIIIIASRVANRMLDDACSSVLTHENFTSQNAEKFAWRTASINASLDVYKQRTIDGLQYKLRMTGSTRRKCTAHDRKWNKEWTVRMTGSRQWTLWTPLVLIIFILFFQFIC